MDASTQKALHDKLYDRRKVGALEVEKSIRDSLAKDDHDKIKKIIEQLCQDYAYAIHQTYARNGGLIGLAAASIALGTEVARYLDEIVPPVLSCFGDHDARVRYYACESMYNIAKTSKGEILPYFNELFDALAKLTADSEPSVKNGSELLDRLVKDIISDSATSYVSILHDSESAVADDDTSKDGKDEKAVDVPTAFSLPRFIPLLQERIYVLNPFTRMFLVSWITLLDSIPDLELVTHLPSFLGGLFRFLNDNNQDVVTATQHVLERFLDEIKMVAKVKRGMVESQRRRDTHSPTRSRNNVQDRPEKLEALDDAEKQSKRTDEEAIEATDSESAGQNASDDEADEEDWVPGQDVKIDHPKILDILVTYLRDSKEDHIQLTALRWIDSFFEICPEDILSFVPRLLNQVLPALSSDIEQVRQAGSRVNNSLMDYIVSLDESERKDTQLFSAINEPLANSGTQSKEGAIPDRKEAAPATQKTSAQDTYNITSTPPPSLSPDKEKGAQEEVPETKAVSLDYEGAVNALTLQFLNEHEATRVAALSWLIMLQSKAPKKVLAAHDGTFPALLKTLSDTSDAVVTRDLQLLSQISKNSDDNYFSFFMVNLLRLFAADRRLLETRGNLIIRQLCVNLSPERIYRTMADALEKEEDVEFASIMVQNLNNNLITAPELGDLRRKLRNWESKDGQALFVALFRSWCYNAVATISLCLLAQSYEATYNLLQVFADIEMTVNMLIQIDKLVQLLESPVFTYLRLQLLEPERYPFLYKTLYGILMLLPQSAAFAALKNRLNSVSAIGYLHVPQPRGSVSGPPSSTSSSLATPSSSLHSRLIKTREDGSVKWGELLEKFRTTQDRASKRHVRGMMQTQLDADGLATSSGTFVNGERKTLLAGTESGRISAPANIGGRPGSADTTGTKDRGIGSSLSSTSGGGAGVGNNAREQSTSGISGASGTGGHKSRFSASNLGKLASGVKGRATGNKK